MAKRTTSRAARRTGDGEPRAAADDRATATPADADVARRAYELYCQRGGEHGRDLDDWLQAERELGRAVPAGSGRAAAQAS